MPTTISERSTGVAASPATVLLMVSGAPRSGTTFLVDLLNSNPAATCFHEVGWANILGSLEPLFAASDRAAQTTRRVDGLPSADLDDVLNRRAAFALERRARNEAQVGELELQPRRSCDAIALLRASFQAISGKQNLRVLGDKTPGIRNADVPKVPGAIWRRLYIVRNPLDVIASSLCRRNSSEAGVDAWHIQTVEEAIAEWVLIWEYLAQEFGQGVDDLLVVKYEDFDRHPDKALSDISKFLGIPNEFSALYERTPTEFHRVGFRHDEEALARSYFGELVSLWDDMPLSKLFTRFPVLAPKLEFGQALSFRSGGQGWRFQRDGFCAPETWGVWTSGSRASLRFALAERPKGEVWLDLLVRPFARGEAVYDFGIGINDEPMQRVSLPSRPDAPEAWISVPTGEVADIVEVKFRIPRPKTALEAPLNDARALGIGLIGLQLREL